MPVKKSQYQHPRLFKNAHVQTIYPYLFRKISGFSLERHRLNTPDGDFLDLDLLSKGSDEVVILSHGLEGSTQTQYIRGMGRALSSYRKDVIAWNMRSCSEEMNWTHSFYHAAKIEDLDQVIQFAIKKGYKKVHLIGFSLGGNLTAFYLGRMGKDLPGQIEKAIIVSAPYDLKSSSMELSKPTNRVYLENFLMTMRSKMKKKHDLIGLPQVDLEKLKLTKTFKEFDDYFTAPLHGFKDAEEYWRECSSIHLLENIHVPTLMLSAKDDPFLGEECYPIKEASKNSNLILEISETGGHVGFVQFNKEKQYWAEKRAIDFLVDIREAA